jgi:hypothetical protein
VRRGLLLVVAGTIVIAGIAITAVVFPTRYGCNDGSGAFTTSQAVAESACGSTAARFPTDTSVVTDERVVPRAVTAVVVVAALALLLLLASRRDADTAPSGAWRPYG